MEEAFKAVLVKLSGKPLLQEFARWLYKNEDYTVSELEALLTKEWNGAYPQDLAGEDLLVDIGDFLYRMAEFACVKVYGENYWKHSQLFFWIVPEPSYEDRSYVFVLELNTKSVLAKGCGHKTWHHNPDTVEEDLEHLIKQLKESKDLLGRRLIVEV